VLLRRAQLRLRFVLQLVLPSALLLARRPPWHVPPSPQLLLRSLVLLRAELLL
jgi:hypothetical protein